MKFYGGKIWGEIITVIIIITIKSWKLGHMCSPEITPPNNKKPKINEKQETEAVV